MNLTLSETYALSDQDWIIASDWEAPEGTYIADDWVKGDTAHLSLTGEATAPDAYAVNRIATAHGRLEIRTVDLARDPVML